jgi:hypothetical protein
VVNGSDLNATAANPDITLGIWHQLEQRVRLSATPTSSDGMLQWWKDGELIGEYVDQNYPLGDFDSVNLQPSWGGVGDTKTQTDHFWMDDVIVCVSP